MNSTKINRIKINRTNNLQIKEVNQIPLRSLIRIRTLPVKDLDLNQKTKKNQLNKKLKIKKEKVLRIIQRKRSNNRRLRMVRIKGRKRRTTHNNKLKIKTNNKNRMKLKINWIKITKI